MDKVIIRKNKLFVIDKSKLKKVPKVDEMCLALYAEIYNEFKGATENINYKDMNSLQLLEEVNKYAYDWLKNRGLI